MTHHRHRLPRLSARRASAAQGKSAGLTLGTAFLFCLCATAGAQEAPRKGSLIAGRASVVDGTSFDIGSNRIRLWGVDASERDAWCYRSGRRWKPAREAAAALRRCVVGKAVTCRVWSVRPEWFRAVYVSECWTEDGLDVGQCMVRGGWANDYTCFSDGYYRDVETEARNAGLGLWTCDNGPGTRRWGNRGRGVPCETPFYRPTGPVPK
jgi:endonuclease YncB( thermonuclease family)